MFKYNFNFNFNSGFTSFRCNILHKSNFSSTIPLHPKVPDLVESKARGKWDSSTVPSTVSDPVEDKYNKDLAKVNHREHLDKDEVVRKIKETCDAGQLLTSKSGHLVIDKNASELEDFDKLLDSCEDTEQAQAMVDFMHRNINSAHALSTEWSIEDKKSDIEKLNRARDLGQNELGNKDVYDNELSSIEKHYLELEKATAQYRSDAKGALRFGAQNSKYDVSSEGLDETNPESVELSESSSNRSSNDTETGGQSDTAMEPSTRFKQNTEGYYPGSLDLPDSSEDLG